MSIATPSLPGELVVVEVGPTAYLGTLKPLPGRGRRVSVRSGLVGRPVVLRMDDIDSVVPANGHPDVVVVRPRRAS